MMLFGRIRFIGLLFCLRVFNLIYRGKDYFKLLLYFVEFLVILFEINKFLISYYFIYLLC